MSRVKSLLQAIILLLQASALGWLRIEKRVIGRLIREIARQGIYRIIYLAACLGMMASSLLPWIAYSIAFFPKEQQANSDLTSLFFLAGLLGAILGFLPYRKPLGLALFLAAAAYYVIATLYPGQLHTAMDPGEYRITEPAYMYGAALLVAALLQTKALSSSWIEQEKLKRWLFQIPQPPSQEKREKMQDG